MNHLPTHLSPEQFAEHVEPYLSKAKRGSVSKIPLSKIFNDILSILHTGCQWAQLPIEPDPDDPTRKELSHDAVSSHVRKWSRDGSLQRVWQQRLLTMKAK